MRYLLVPIKNIDDINPEDYHKRPIALKNKIVSVGKQISLSENDIEQKAHLAYSDDRTDEYIEGYKQALKDLI